MQITCSNCNARYTLTSHQIKNIKRNLESKRFKKIVVACETENIRVALETEYEASKIDPGNCKVTILLVNALMP